MNAWWSAVVLVVLMSAAVTTACAFHTINGRPERRKR